MIATFDAIESSLGRWPRLRRYRDGLDGFSSKEGAFTACGFWAADYLARRGDADGARRRIAAMVETGNDLRLFSEESDPESGEQLGNFPQGLSHAALIGAVLALREAEQVAAS
jgi:GH15 family glucan-1,4-alpha-glucosidase